MINYNDKKFFKFITLGPAGTNHEFVTKKYIKRLELLIKKENLIRFDEIIVAQYNAPWAIPPFRKNEILITIKKNE